MTVLFTAKAAARNAPKRLHAAYNEKDNRSHDDEVCIAAFVCQQQGLGG